MSNIELLSTLASTYTTIEQNIINLSPGTDEPDNNLQKIAISIGIILIFGPPAYVWRMYIHDLTKKDPVEKTPQKDATQVHRIITNPENRVTLPTAEGWPEYGHESDDFMPRPKRDKTNRYRRT